MIRTLFRQALNLAIQIRHCLGKHWKMCTFSARLCLSKHRLCVHTKTSAAEPLVRECPNTPKENVFTVLKMVL